MGMLDNLNQQFLPAVRLTDVNITHAEPSSQEYRMDLAAPEMVRVAKEAYTYEYELQLRKEQNEGDLIKELAGLQETLSRDPGRDRRLPGADGHRAGARLPPGQGPGQASAWSRRSPPPRPTRRCWRRRRWTSGR